ncbi:unnamed protein product [Lactuca saligna]|uniref:Uncharacterized protein n=1 Tax=Lactuca saligna TaxID=75948 RepID=A0AA35V711_LACSI|nr:unnamed protein product [Lactuca saligna]
MINLVLVFMTTASSTQSGSGSGSKRTWRTYGSLRVKDELQLAPGGSFTKVNGDNLQEITGGEVAIANLNTCNGPEFVLQLRFPLNHDDATSTRSPGDDLTCDNANLEGE